MSHYTFSLLNVYKTVCRILIQISSDVWAIHMQNLPWKIYCLSIQTYAGDSDT